MSVCLLGYLQFTRHLSACTHFPLESLYIKITLIYSILTYMCVCRGDIMKATSIQSNKNTRAVNLFCEALNVKFKSFSLSF